MLPCARLFLIVILLLGLTRLALAGNSTECGQGLMGTDVSIKQAQEMGADWMARRGKNVEKVLLNPWMNHKVERRHAEIWDVTGIPETLKQVSTKDVVFRHYAPKETIEAIMSSKVLMTSFLSYVEAAPGVYKKNWANVTGAFLTMPETSPHSTGVAEANAAHYVDVKIPDGIPVFELERGTIYIIPMKPNYRRWVRDVYAKYKSGAEISISEREMAQRIEHYQGDIDDFVGAIPIEIVGSGK